MWALHPEDELDSASRLCWGWGDHFLGLSSGRAGCRTLKGLPMGRQPWPERGSRATQQLELHAESPFLDFGGKVVFLKLG